MDKKAIIIGSGVGGMAAAIRLSCMGYRVDVFEKNSYPGGKLSHFEQDGYQFDAGPSLFTQPANIEELFQLAGEPVLEYFTYRKASETCRYFFSNGKRVTAWADKELFAIEMQEKLGEPAENVLNYLQRSSALYHKVGELFLRHSLHRPSHFSWKEIWGALASTRPPYLFRSLDSYNRQRFSTAEAVQLFDRYATYNGSNPYRAPAMLSLIPHLEMNQGTFFADGGMISITNALYKLACRKGVKFHFDTPVSRILEHGGIIAGVEAGGVRHDASLVVSNQDVYFTYRELLGRNDMANKVLKQERSSSALIFYWGIGQPFEELGLHNIFFSGNYQKEFGHIFNTGDVATDPTIYINITSKMEAGMAPTGKENWFVMVNVPANTGQDWDTLKQVTRINVVKKLNRILRTDIGSLIETEATLDPVTIASKTMSYMGSLYGTSSNSKMAAFLRHPNFSDRYKGLYFVGGSVHPGGGIPLCLRSAAI
ncbi:MAG TPA: 1-hydroxycarotenoid 3,4-desaturase CrtD, partial [Phnomibacter sp.]|nr:1-hydroxycarotenoid 3,4-desaturase CrtD [Phnomibacter sp.]